MPDIVGQSMIVCGNKGSGKTYYSKALCVNHNYTTLVATPHKHDFDHMGDEFIYLEDYNPKDSDSVERLFKLAKKLAQKGVIDVFFVDELDMAFRYNYDLGQEAHDLIINQRHYGVGMIGVTRRPQDIPQFIYGQTTFKVAFSLEAPGATKKFNQIYRGFGDDVMSLRHKSRDYYIKEPGVQPTKYNSVEVCQERGIHFEK
jgi:hypothetical protein